MDKICVIVKILIILALVLLFLNLYRKSQQGQEGFTTQQDYIKFNETVGNSWSSNKTIGEGWCELAGKTKEKYILKSKINF